MGLLQHWVLLGVERFDIFHVNPMVIFEGNDIITAL